MKDLLVAASVGVFPPTPAAVGDWLITISKMPDTRDRCIALFDTGGLAPEPKWLLDYPDVVVLIRGGEYQETFNKMKEVQNTLFSIPAQEINGDWWAGTIMIGNPAFVQYDEKDRPIFSMTLRVYLEPADVAGDHRQPL
jgi:hypothetical protein